MDTGFSPKHRQSFQVQETRTILGTERNSWWKKEFTSQQNLREWILIQILATAKDSEKKGVGKNSLLAKRQPTPLFEIHVFWGGDFTDTIYQEKCSTFLSVGTYTPWN